MTQEKQEFMRPRDRFWSLQNLSVGINIIICPVEQDEKDAEAAESDDGYTVICDLCKKKYTLPFKINPKYPVFCKMCFILIERMAEET
jgi:CxxC-x17-CxxC domain-containing protein